MDHLTIFGVLAVSSMLACDALERRNHWFTLAFGFACIASSAYGFLSGSWPFGVLEGIWSCLKFWQFYGQIRSRRASHLVDQNEKDE